MVKKSDIVKDAVREQEWKKALQIAKDFRIGVTQEQRNRMARAYECIVHPDFYRQIGVDITDAIEQGKAVVKEYSEGRKNSMKWDVKHDKAKRVIDMFLEGADTWQKTGEFVIPSRGELTGGLTDEDRALVSEEVATIIASIRKRYKLQERLPEQEAQIRPEKAEAVIPTEKAEETLPEPICDDKETEKPKRTRRASIGEKKATSRRKKKEIQEESSKVYDAEKLFEEMRTHEREDK